MLIFFVANGASITGNREERKSNLRSGKERKRFEKDLAIRVEARQIVGMGCREETNVKDKLRSQPGQD